MLVIKFENIKGGYGILNPCSVVVGNLESLTTLKVDNNQLTALPSTIGGYV